MDQVESLSSIISGKGESAPVTTEAPASPAVAPETKETTAPETKAQTRDETGKFAKAAEPTPETKEPAAAAPTKDDTDGRTVALRAERERRRQLEAKLRELEQQRSQPEAKVSIFDDEDKGISTRVAEHLRPLRETNFNMSMKLARLTYKDDFDKAEQAFFDSAEGDPRLYDQLRGSPDPGEFIYTIGTQIAELGPVGGNFAKYREQITAQNKAELAKRDEQIAALTAKLESLEKSQQALEQIPRSLNKGSESAPRSVAEADPTDLKSLVRFKTG
jgi:hypothetical protein